MGVGGNAGVGGARLQWQMGEAQGAVNKLFQEVTGRPGLSGLAQQPPSR
jgi:hypothetical protein